MHVIADEQVELAVVVVINERGARAPAIGRTAYSRFRGHFVKLAVAVIMEKMIAAHRRDEHVGQSVIVVIPDRHAHAVEANVETRAGGDVGEMTVAVVVIERHRCRRFAVGNMTRATTVELMKSKS